MRTYTVTRKKSSKLGKVSYSVGPFTLQFKKGSAIFRNVPEVIAVRVAVDYKDDFDVKIEVENAEPEELILDENEEK